ncbi:MAG: fatty acid desaturase family protein, partial [Burkholderiales bacterium]
MKSNRTLTASEIDAFGAELDQLRHRTVATLGERDATYIRRIRTSVRITELAGRLMLFAGFFPPTFILGVLLLGVSKIIDNMELGHNVMHGQFDFMNEPEFCGKRFEWNHACPADFWRYTHNYEHHTYTNILGKDKDLGYGLVRLFPEQRWNPGFLLQPLYALLLAILFQYGVAIQHLKMNRLLNGKMSKAEFGERFQPFWHKLRH